MAPAATDPMAGARCKADAAFEFFTQARRAVLLLPRPRRGARRRDAARERGRTCTTHGRRARRASRHDTGMKLLWGTANLFSHRRYMAGAATNPDPEVFAYAAAQVKKAHGSDAATGRRELRAVGRPRRLRDAAQHRPEARAATSSAASCSMVVEHKHKIGFKGTILIEPKPHEPTKHQYDFDVATVYGFLQQLRPGEGSQGQHRGQPRHARRPQLRARDRAAAGAGHLRLDRHEPRRPAVRLGHRPVPEQPAPRWRWRCTTSCRAAASPPAA